MIVLYDYGGSYVQRASSERLVGSSGPRRLKLSRARKGQATGARQSMQPTVGRLCFFEKSISAGISREVREQPGRSSTAAAVRYGSTVAPQETSSRSAGDRWRLTARACFASTTISVGPIQAETIRSMSSTSSPSDVRPSALARWMLRHGSRSGDVVLSRVVRVLSLSVSCHMHAAVARQARHAREARHGRHARPTRRLRRVLRTYEYCTVLYCA